MKTRTNITYRMVLMAMISTGVPAVADAAIYVQLEVSGGDSLIVIGNGSQCANGPLDCIEVTKGSSPNLYFDLDKACKSGGPEYQLEQIRIAMADKDWPTAGNPLPDDVADDFYADKDTGVIDLVRGNHGWNKLSKDRIKLKDKNSREYMVFYEITARQCDGNGTIVLDPMVRNDGR